MVAPSHSREAEAGFALIHGRLLDSSEVDKGRGTMIPCGNRSERMGFATLLLMRRNFAQPETRKAMKGRVDTKTFFRSGRRTKVGFVMDGGVDVNSWDCCLKTLIMGPLRSSREASHSMKRFLTRCDSIPRGAYPGHLGCSERWVEDLTRDGIRDVCEEWGLRGLTAEQAIRVIREKFFSREFTYSMFLRGEHPSRKSSAVARFLSETRVGHCEYYATAAVLLLREAGIPARYCGIPGRKRRTMANGY